MKHQIKLVLVPPDYLTINKEWINGIINTIQTRCGGLYGGKDMWAPTYGIMYTNTALDARYEKDAQGSRTRLFLVCLLVL